MRNFTPKELKRISELDSHLEILVREVNNEYPVFVVCGHRNKEDQELAFAQGFSKVRYPNGKHNKLPSLAVDLCPYPIDWNDLKRFREMQAVIMKVAKNLGTKIRSGADFNGDGNLTNDKFVDLPHIELI